MNKPKLGRTWVRMLPSLAALALLLSCTTASARDTVLAPGDTLTISVAEDSSFDKTYTVDQQGNITLPLVGPYKVAGKTGQQLQQELAGKDAIGKYVVNPTVLVQVAEVVGNQIRVYGEVKAPSIMRMKDGATLMDALQAVGMPTANADTARATILRIGSTQPVGVDLDALIKGDLSKNITLQDGDTIYIPPKAPPAPVKVIGEVVKQGEVPLEPGMTVHDAIIRAGGFTDMADKTRVEVVRKGGTSVILDLDDPSGASPNSTTPAGVMPVMEGDTIVVHDNGNLMFSITGGVRKGGQYPVKKAMRLTDAIDMAGGLSEIAQLKQVMVVRGPNSPEPNKIIPVDFQKLQRGDIAQNIEIRPGDSVFVGQENVRRAGGFSFVGRVVDAVLSMATYGLFVRR